jgi:hypothetical protein
MQPVEVKFGEWIQKGFDLYKANLGTLILVSLLAMVLSALTVGILAGPMSVGVILVTLALLDKKDPKPEVGEVFKGFNYFAQSLVFFFGFIIIMLAGSFILGLIPCVGQVLSILYCYGLQAVLMFGFFNIADKKMDFLPAAQASIDVVKTNFWLFLGLNIVASILSSLGVIACGIGIVVTMPLYFCIIAVAYREIAVAGATPASEPAQ